MYTTPLRYPGGKSIMTSFLSHLFEINGWKDIVYAEPYAGGAGAAVNLLLTQQVNRILINDANIGIYSFWKAIKEENKKLCEWVLTKPITLEAWNYWHKVFMKADVPSFELGFATFFLTRTNRSGILNAGPIGGNSQQQQDAAKYKLDCRFNRTELAKRIANIGDVAFRVEVSNLDAIHFLKAHNGDDSLFVYLDPPYFQQGKSLYMDYYKATDHYALASFLKNEARFNWLMSYDCVPEIKRIYSDFELYEFSLNYSARNARIGKELLTHRPGISLPENMCISEKKEYFKLIHL